MIDRWGAWADAWAGWMIPLAVQVAVLIGTIAVLDTLLGRRIWPQLRNAVWLLVPLKLLLPPGLASPVAVAPRILGEPVVGAAGAIAPDAGAADSWVPWLAALWLLGIAVLAACALVRRRRARDRLLAGSEPVPAPVRAAFDRAASLLRLRRVPRLAVSTTAAVPAVSGTFRPVVVLPAALAGARAEELLHIFLHESAHVRRRDLWVQALFGASHLLLWFHPGLWFARQRAYALRELCCDATVASVLKDAAPAYRRTLLREARRLLLPAAVPGVAAFFGGTPGIVVRLRCLEREHWKRPARRRCATAAAVFVMGVAVLPMARAAGQAAVELSTFGNREVEEARREVEAAMVGESCLTLRYAMQRLLYVGQEAATQR